MTRGPGRATASASSRTSTTLAGASAENLEKHPEWVREVEIELTALRSSVAVTSGAPQQIDGIDIEERSGDGTMTAVDFEIPSGSRY